jgi:hypothetical protein
VRVKKLGTVAGPKVEPDISSNYENQSTEYQEKYDKASRDLDELEALETRLRRQLALDPNSDAVMARAIDIEVADLQARIARIKRDCGFVGIPAELASTAHPTLAPPNWCLAPVVKLPGYREALHQYVKVAHAAGEPLPRASDVVDEWRRNPIWPVCNVDDDGLVVFENAKGRRDTIGDTREKTLDNIRAAIARMTVRNHPNRR